MATPAEIAIGAVEWREVQGEADPSGELPHVTHEGELRLAGYTLRVYQLCDGQRIVDSDDLQRAFGMQAQSV